MHRLKMASGKVREVMRAAAQRIQINLYRKVDLANKALWKAGWADG